MFPRKSCADARPRCSASRHTGVSPLTAASVQTAAQRVQCPSQLGIFRGQAHGTLELAQCLPPSALLHVDPREVHIGELPGLVPLGVLRPLQPRHRLVELALLHQVTPYVVVGVPEVGVDVDGAHALLRRLVEPALEAVRPAQEGVGLGCGADLDRAAVELDGTVELTLHLVPVGFLPDLGRLVEALALLHEITSWARSRAEGPCPRTSTRSGWSSRSAAASPRARRAQGRPRPGPPPRAPRARPSRTPRRRRCRSTVCRVGRWSRRARAPCRPPSRSSSTAAPRPALRGRASRRPPTAGSSCRRGLSAPGASTQPPRGSVRSPGKSSRKARARP